MKKRIPMDTVVSFSAIVVAIASIVVTVWQGIEMRKHNRLSVRPRLEITYEVNKKGFGYVLKNNGLGPAVVTSKKFFVDGKEVQEDGFSGYDVFIEKLGLKNRQVVYTGIFPGKTITAGAKLDIIRFFWKEGETVDSLLQTLLPQVYNRISLEIGYKSMYNEMFVARIPQ